jgi:uncharacterized protein YndB with AHSA1/START domain
MTSKEQRFVDPDRQSGRILRKETLVPATLQDVWHAWTATEGTKTFFSPRTHVELAVGGPYEILFSLDAPAGSQGSEGCLVLSYLPLEMLSFSWNAPPEFGGLRGQYTIVVLRFEEVEPGMVKVLLWHHGWGKGEKWDRLYDYFDKAWSYVLSNLKKRFVAGPIDWQAR